MKKIGIVGGGQLGRMLTQAAHKFGFFVTVLDPTENSPAAQVADAHILGSFKDKNKILELAKVSDYITFEIESANPEALNELIQMGKVVHPSPKTLRIIKDKFEQKTFLSNRNIPVAPFALINSKEDAKEQGSIFGYPFLLKTRFDAYDGRGNYVVRSEEDLDKAFEKLGNSALYAEKFFPFVKELAVVSARSYDGTLVVYPVVETIHKNNICHIVKSPAPVSKELQEKAKKLAKEVLSSLEDVGVFAIEMFLDNTGNIAVNEIAPRVHNSGHHTIEAFSMSQFEAHIRAVTHMPIYDPQPLSESSVMINILGDRGGEALIKGSTEKRDEDAYIHIYGKMETRNERKMGHITVLGTNLEDTEKRALEIRSNINI